MIFKPIVEVFEQYHSIVAAIYKGIILITSQLLELKSLNHSETCILNGTGYIPLERLETKLGFLAITNVNHLVMA